MNARERFVMLGLVGFCFVLAVGCFARAGYIFYTTSLPAIRQLIRAAQTPAAPEDD